MSSLIDGACLGEAMLAVICLVGVSVLSGLALARLLGLFTDRRLAGRDWVISASGGLPPAEDGSVRKV